MDHRVNDTQRARVHCSNTAINFLITGCALMGTRKVNKYTSVFGDGRISTHADPTPTRRTHL